MYTLILEMIKELLFFRIIGKYLLRIKACILTRQHSNKFVFQKILHLAKRYYGPNIHFSRSQYQIKKIKETLDSKLIFTCVIIFLPKLFDVALRWKLKQSIVKDICKQFIILDLKKIKISIYFGIFLLRKFANG